VVATPPGLHTGDMAAYATASVFVTDAGGFVGTELIKVLRARHQVFGLTPSVKAAEHGRRAGAVPVMGELLEPDH
jgi:nucleoside-diphosphate-sugar epimerase